MFSFIVTIITLPFMPVFMLANFSGHLESGQAQVLGTDKARAEIDYDNETCQDNSQNLQNYNLFPLDQSYTQGLAPQRRSDYGDITIFAGSSVVIDVDSGTILHYYNGRKQTQIASLTKVMTAVLVVEKVKDLDEEVTITKEALRVPGTVVGCPTSVFCNANRMYAGEKVRVKDLLKAMLLNSANDAATALGIHIAGSEKNFVKMMNEKAKELGLKDSNFCTPSGLEIDGRESDCYSSAYDIARIASYSLRHKLIWEIMRIEETQIYSSDGKYMHQLKNTDVLLSEMSDCIGGKTGFTPMAGKSLLLAATDPTRRHRIVAVILNDENRWTDMKKLVSWTFDNYDWR